LQAIPETGTQQRSAEEEILLTMETADRIVQQDSQYLWHHLKPHRLFQQQEQMVAASGEGLFLTDVRGRRYLDATSGGVWCVNVGYGRKRIAAAMEREVRRLPYFAGVYGTIPAAGMAARLAELLPGMSKVFFSSSGSEANEKAYKMIRQAAAFHPHFKGRTKILYRHRDYHGTTYATMSSSGHPERKVGFEPLCPGFVEVPHALCYRCAFGKTYPACDIDCARAVETVLLREGPESVGALILEPITAGGGVIPPVQEYFPMVQAILRKYGVKLILDEVVCGFGRTGTFWGHQHYDVSPDMVTAAKGITSAYAPLSATLVHQQWFDLFLNDPGQPEERINFFRDISTYGGCTAGFAAGLENIAIIEEEGLVERSRKMGAYLMQGLAILKDLPGVGDVRGKGLFCGIEFVADKRSREPACEKTMAELMGGIFRRGVLVGRTNTSLPGLNNTLNLAPALTVEKEQIDRIVEVIGETIRDVF
jgi:taurine-pyruvate aminotransferase